MCLENTMGVLSSQYFWRDVRGRLGRKDRKVIKAPPALRAPLVLLALPARLGR
jgi:hypothetical protein